MVSTKLPQRKWTWKVKIKRPPSSEKGGYREIEFSGGSHPPGPFLE